MLGVNFAWQAAKCHSIAGSFFNNPVRDLRFESVALDITCKQSVQEVCKRISPDVVIHTAAMTNVELCEDNPVLAGGLNHVATRNVAESARDIKAKLVHISTDHLFDGQNPWSNETDIPTPLNVYAKTKAIAEEEVLQTCTDGLIIRTNFFGWGTQRRSSFSDWILNNLSTNSELTMFQDSYFTPILINDLVDIILKLVCSDARGIFNVVGRERVSKYEFAIKLAQYFGYPITSIKPIEMDKHAFKATRPKDMSLSSQKISAYLGKSMPNVDESLSSLLDLKKMGWHNKIHAAGLTTNTL